MGEKLGGRTDISEIDEHRSNQKVAQFPSQYILSPIIAGKGNAQRWARVEGRRVHADPRRMDPKL